MSNNRNPRLRPVTRIELTDKERTLRIIAALVLFALGVTAIGFGISALLTTGSGWTEVEASAEDLSWSGDFVLNYKLGASGMNSKEENRRVAALYNQAMVDCYQLFSPDDTSDREDNLRYLNQNINRQVTVAPALYSALELLERYENRCIYLAPVYVEYKRVFSAENDDIAKLYDPMKNEEVRSFTAQAAAYANDPAMIRLELLGGGQVCLYVAEEYLTFARENGIEEFIDFNWMTNAFVADYVAGVLAENGFTKGYLSSYDGFTVNLDSGSYTSNVFDRRADGIYMPGRFHYTGPACIVTVRDYPMSQRDQWHYYAYADGSITSVYIDPADGICGGCVPQLTCVSKNTGCAEMLLRMIPVFFGDSLSQQTLAQLSRDGISSVWTENGALRFTGTDLEIENVG